MEKLSSLGLTFDRVLIQLLIPGLASILPIFTIYLNHYGEERKYLLENPTLLLTSLTMLGLVAGMILENIGSIIEVKHYDKKNQRADSLYEDTWKKFLTINYDGKEPTGHRYLRNILMRMKFELSFGIALLPLGIGLEILDYQYCLINSIWLKIIILYIIPLFGFIYLIFFEAYDSSIVLAKTRKLLVEKYYTT